MVPDLQPPAYCSNLVRNGGQLDLDKIHPYGRIKSNQVLTDVDQSTIVDDLYCQWLYKKYDVRTDLTHGIVKPTPTSMINQIVKFAEPVNGTPDVELFEEADHAVRIVLSSLIGTCRFTQFDDVELNMDAANGYPLNTFYRSKGDAIHACYRELKWWLTDGWKDNIPQYIKLTGKVERLPLEEIRSQKCRAFQPDPTQIVLFEAQLCQDMISKFKAIEGTFSAYGFNKWEGGWHRLFSNFDGFEYYFAGDVERWDKHYQPYHHDANTRLKKDFITPEHRKDFGTDERFDYINRHAKNLHLCLWTGDIVSLEQGQGSGRYTTTFDNILTHMRLMFYHYYRVRRKYNLDLPTRPWEIKEHFNAFVFGDDSCGATSVKELASFEERQQSYNENGFRLKPADDFESTSILGMPFLGAKVGLFSNRYVFIMDPNRIHGSMTALQRNMNTQEKFERTFQVFMNCVFTETLYPQTDTPLWKVLYERVKDLRSGLSATDLGAYSTIFSVEVYRNLALGLESNILNGIVSFDPPVDFERVADVV